MEKSSFKLRILPFIYTGILLIIGYIFITSVSKISTNKKLKETNNEEIIDNYEEKDYENSEEADENIIDDGSSNTVLSENNNQENEQKNENNKIEVQKINLNKTATYLYLGGSETLYATLTPNNVTDKTVTWTSSDKKIVSVDGGKIKGLKKGTATIKVKSSNGKEASCKVTVYGSNIAVKSISLNRSNATIAVSSSIQLKAAINPSNATNQNITWTSSNTSVATVSKTGKVTGKKAGYSVIRATTVDGKRIAEATITVKASKVSTKVVPVTRISLNKSTSALNVGSTTTLKAIITPSNATNKKIIWASSNSKVATVNSNGLVTAKALGTAKITAKSADGSKVATAVINVTKKVVKVTSITINNVTIKVGKSATLSLKIKPSNATNQEVTWTSSNTKIATVSKTGKVTGKKAGKVTITATAKDGSGKRGTAVVTVK